eukprot:scaffold13723_cov119-Isochrysis_galbana.AAC.2
MSNTTTSCSHARLRLHAPHRAPRTATSHLRYAAGGAAAPAPLHAAGTASAAAAASREAMRMRLAPNATAATAQGARLDNSTGPGASPWNAAEHASPTWAASADRAPRCIPMMLCRAFGATRVW